VDREATEAARRVRLAYEHERAHHQKVEEVRNIKAAVAQVELLETNRMVRLFLLVYRLPSEALPMLQIYTLARLISLLQFRDAANYVLNVGNNYVNHMAAKDMTMSMTAVLREWINVRARLSPVLELMIDESTDIPNHKVLLLYLRFLVDGRYVTMFWSALSVVDATKSHRSRVHWQEGASLSERPPLARAGRAPGGEEDTRGGRGGGEQSRGKPSSGSGPFSAYFWGYSAFQYSWHDEPPQRIAARAASQRLPRPFGPRQ
jgi:hypothetical protein